MEILLDITGEALIDTLKLVPFLFVTYLIMEYIESKTSEKTQSFISRVNYTGPFFGAFLGAFPQCGFSAAAATLYAGRVITLGTLVTVFLATSDEMLPILIAEHAEFSVILKILGFKVMAGMVSGFILDAIARAVSNKTEWRLHIHDLCEAEHCECEDGIVKSAARHTLHVSLFIFLVTFALAAAIEFVGLQTFTDFIVSHPNKALLASAVVGLIPNCAASVVITELYLSGALGAGAMMSGLMVSAGVGLLVLFRTNRPMRNNIIITVLVFFIGIFWGLMINLFGITF